MIDKTEALVLRINPYSQTSHIVTWLSPQAGRLVTVIKGANRAKSDFLGQYDLFQTCELLYYTRDRNGIHIARECTPLRLRQAFRSRWRSAAAASYVCDIVSRVSPDGAPDPQLYELTSTTLDTLARQADGTQEIIFWFELKLLERLGMAPLLTSCSVCGGEAGTRVDCSDFSATRGGIICKSCREQRVADATPITPAALTLMRRWLGQKASLTTQSTRCTSNQLLELRSLQGVFLAHHLETLPDSRKIAFEMAAFQIPLHRR